MIRPTAVRALARTSPRAFQPTPRFAAASIKPEFQPHLGRFTPGTLKRWIPTLALWGGAAGSAVLLLGSAVPLIQKDILDKVPVLREYFVDTVPDSDKPF